MLDQVIIAGLICLLRDPVQGQSTQLGLPVDSLGPNCFLVDLLPHKFYEECPSPTFDLTRSIARELSELKNLTT